MDRAGHRRVVLLLLVGMWAHARGTAAPPPPPPPPPPPLGWPTAGGVWNGTPPHAAAAERAGGSLPRSRTDTWTDVFYAGEGGYAAMKIPGFVSLRPHKVALAFAEGRKFGCDDWHGQHDLVMKRSTDAGASFGQLRVVINASRVFGTQEAGPHGGAVWDITPVFDAQRSKLHVFFAYSPARYNRPCTGAKPCENQGYAYPWAHEEWLITSTDLGSSFSTPRNMSAVTASTPWCYKTFSGGKGVQLRNGSLVVPGYHCRTCSFKCDYEAMHLWTSEDGDRWAVTDEFAIGCAEGEVVELPGLDPSTLFASMRIDSVAPHCTGPAGGAKKCRRTMRTTAASLNWSAPLDAGSLPDPGCKGGLAVWEAGGGILQANDASDSKRVNISVHLSMDRGVTWPHSQVICADQGGYAVVDMLDDNMIGVLFERAEPGTCDGTNMSFARIDARDLAQRTALPPQTPAMRRRLQLFSGPTGSERDDVFDDEGPAVGPLATGLPLETPLGKDDGEAEVGWYVTHLAVGVATACALVMVLPMVCVCIHSCHEHREADPQDEAERTTLRGGSTTESEG